MKRSSAMRLAKYMETELARSLHHLKAPGHPRPYYISYLLRDYELYSVWGSYGAIYRDQLERKRNCYADVRVGSYRFDQVTKGGLNDNSEDAESFDLLEMPLDDSEDAIRFSLWRLTDARYREAVARYHGRKSRNVSFLDENRGLPSFSRAEAEQSILKLSSLELDPAYWQDYIRRSSRTLRSYTKIKNSYCEFNASLLTKIFINSEGVLRVWQEPIYSLTAYMWFHSKKASQDYTIVQHGTKLSDLPELSVFDQQIKEQASLLNAMENGDEMSSYNGPVLMAARPAGLFLHEVVGHRLEGSRLLSDTEGRTFKDMRQKKIMHEDLSIYDDPKLRTFAGQSLVGSYPFDDEGSPAQRASLVERGVLKGFLSTRSPLKKTGHRSNGHARNHGHERPISRMANLLIESHSQHSWADLKEQLLREVRKRKLPFGIILLDVEGGETETEAYDFQAFLGEITVAVKVYPNGKERYVRGVDFVGTPLGSLSNIMAVGCEYSVDNGYCGAESGTIPVSTIAPPLLLSNLELQVKDPSKLTEYALPLPWADKRRLSR